VSDVLCGLQVQVMISTERRLEASSIAQAIAVSIIKTALIMKMTMMDPYMLTICVGGNFIIIHYDSNVPKSARPILPVFHVS